MPEQNDSAIRALLDDALERLGKARLSVDLAAELLERSRKDIGAVGEKIAAAAADLRTFAINVQSPTEENPNGR